MATAKKRNPADSTLRNVRAARKAIALLAVALTELEKRVEKLERLATSPIWVPKQKR